MVPEWLARMRGRLGELALCIVTGSMSDGATALEQGTADFLLSFTHPRLPLVLDEARFEALATVRDKVLPVASVIHSMPPCA